MSLVKLLVKVFLGLLLLVHVILQTDALNYEATVKNCTAANNLTAAEVDKFRRSPRNVSEYVSNMPIKCYMNCMLEASRTIKNGTFLIENFRPRYAKAKPIVREYMETIVKTCHNAAGANKTMNPCDSAYNLYACMEVKSTEIEPMLHNETVLERESLEDDEKEPETTTKIKITPKTEEDNVVGIM